MIVCSSCAGTEADGAMFPERLPRYRRGKSVCTACLDEQRRAAEADYHVRQQYLVTRASYRAAYRQRAKQPQLDLVDMLRPPA